MDYRVKLLQDKGQVTYIAQGAKLPLAPLNVVSVDLQRRPADHGAWLSVNYNSRPALLNIIAVAEQPWAEAAMLCAWMSLSGDDKRTLDVLVDAEGPLAATDLMNAQGFIRRNRHRVRPAAIHALDDIANFITNVTCPSEARRFAEKFLGPSARDYWLVNNAGAKLTQGYAVLPR